MTDDTTHVGVIPPCDICIHVHKREHPLPAHVDGKTTMGPWAFMCEPHFAEVGVGLGLGRGQILILREVVDASRNAE